MKKLELQNFGVVEMGAKEMQETDGGINPFLEAVWPLVAAYVLLEAALNPTAHVKAFMKGFNTASF